MLNIGDKIFVPNYGAGIIDRIEDKEVCDIIRRYVGVSLLLENIYLLIPTTKLDAYKIRLVLSREEMDESLALIKEIPPKIQAKWGKRYRENNEKINSGKSRSICEVLRDLYYLRRKELLPKGEQKILERAESMLCSEMCLIYDITMEKAQEMLINLSE